MRDITTVVATLVNVTTTGEGLLVDTRPTVGTRDNKASGARFFLNVTSLTGTAPTADFIIVVVLDSVDITIGTFTQATGATSESIDIANCPLNVKAKHTLGGTVTDLDAVVTCIRL